MKLASAAVTLGALGVGLVWLSRRQGYSPILSERNRNINALVPTPAEQSAYWGRNSPGLPTPGTNASEQGTVQPGTLAGRLASWFNFGSATTWWSAPNAGTTTQPTKPADPAGLQIIGPSTPSTYTPQSQTSPQSQLLPADLYLRSPLAFNPLYFGLSTVDPYAAAAIGAGGYVDVRAIDPTERG